MQLPLRRAFCLCCFCSSWRAAQTAPDVDCNLTMIAQMPLQVQDHLLVVPAGINGKWVRLVVDSGAERTTISDATAERLGLPHDPRYTTRSLGIGGATTTTDVTIERLVLGGVHFPDHPDRCRHLQLAVRTWLERRWPAGR